MLEENEIRDVPYLTVVKQITFSLPLLFFENHKSRDREDLMPTNSILQFFVHQIIQYE